MKIMSDTPIRRAQFRVADFVAWLAKNGAELCVPTNPYEVVRYRAYHRDSKRPLTHIVYAKENGLLNWQGATREHYRAFLAGERVKGMFVSKFDPPEQTVPEPPAAPKQSSTDKIRARLQKRDGDDCWFCGSALGADRTIEHLIAKTHGGGNSLANLVLAHQRCNALAADMSIADKVSLRERLRAASVSA